MDKQLEQFVQQIHDTVGRVVVVTAGAGSQALAWLLGVAGASRTLIEGRIPYDWHSFDDFLGRTPEQYVAPETARRLAGRAAARARWLLNADELLFGLACTATIATDRSKRGNHRAHVAIWTDNEVRWHSLQMLKGARERAEEEDLVSRLMLNALAEQMGISLSLPLSLISGDTLSSGHCNILEHIEEVVSGELSQFELLDDGLVDLAPPQPQALLSGSFNPLHEGHLSLAIVAAEITGLPAAFEIVVENADKPTLSAIEVSRRAAQFAGRWPVFVSRAPTFAEKAPSYPGSTFVVGADTARRVLALRFYGGREELLDAAMTNIRNFGCRFLVAGRVNETGQFQSASEIDIPAAYRDLFTPIPSEEFRRDISSTYLRQTGQPGSR